MKNPARMLLAASAVTVSLGQECNKDLYSVAVMQDEGPGAGMLLAIGEPWQTRRNATMGAFIELNPASEACTSGPSKVGMAIEVADGSTLLEWFANLPNEYETRFNITDAQGECKDNPLAAGCIPPNDYVPLDFPGTNTTFNPFQYIGVNWNPIGHPPLDVYDKAHFDFHFFMQSQNDTEGIVPSATEPCTEGLSPDSFYKANTPVPEGCFPDGYANLNAVAPFMGNHYIKLDEPVIAAALGGAPDPSLWNNTSFIVGGYDGAITFLEPMVPRSTLEDLVQKAVKSDADVGLLTECTKATTPAQYPRSGFYPTSFCIASSPTSVLIYMKDFEYVEAGCGKELARNSFINAFPPPPGTPPLPAYCKAPLYESPAASPTQSPETTTPTSSPTTSGTVASSLLAPAALAALATLY